LATFDRDGLPAKPIRKNNTLPLVAWLGRFCSALSDSAYIDAGNDIFTVTGRPGIVRSVSATECAGAGAAGANLLARG